MKSRRFPRFNCLFLLVGLATGRLQADTFTVSRTNNTGPGSLPVILTQANATPGSHTIEFGVSGTILLVAPLPTITNGLTINGRVDSPVVISGGGTVPIFTFAAGTTSILSRLTLVNGHSGSGGAAIANAGTLFVSDSVITNHSSPGGSGGAINNAGTMTVVSSALTGNQAASGGAIANGGVMTIANSTLSGNQAGNGGAIYNTGGGTLTLTALSVSRNTATLGFGGGIYNAGTLAAYGSTLSGNLAIGNPGQNGAAGAYRDNFDINSPTLGYGTGGGGGGGGGAGLGGGVFTASGSISMTNCTFSGNSSIGGKGGDGGLGGSHNGTHSSAPAQEATEVVAVALRLGQEGMVVNGRFTLVTVTGQKAAQVVLPLVVVVAAARPMRLMLREDKRAEQTAASGVERAVAAGLGILEMETPFRAIPGRAAAAAVDWAQQFLWRAGTLLS